MIKAVQQFQIRNEIKNEAMAEDTLYKMKEAGFDGIELCAFMLGKMSFGLRMICKMAGMPVGSGGKYDWHKLIKKTGLKVVSLHEDLGSIEKRPQEIIADALSYETEYVVITGMYHFDYLDETAVHELAKRLNEAGRVMKESGLKLLYHNHNCEFRRFPDGRMAYDILLEETDPEYVNFEFDSYWALDAGMEPSDLMKRLGNRMKLYHINDRGNREMGPKGSILKTDSMELGCGSMPLEKYLRLAEENKTEAVILESHRNWADKSAVKSFQISGEYLKSHWKVSGD